MQGIRGEVRQHKSRGDGCQGAARRARAGACAMWHHVNDTVIEAQEDIAMELHSESFKNDDRIPELYTCSGRDHSPHLAWSGAPRATRSYALIVDDPDAPAGTFAHWGIYDIPPEMTHLDEGFSGRDAQAVGARQVMNDFGRRGYGGPCPPHGHGVHHYRFQLLALDVDHLEVPERADCRQLEEAAHTHVLNRARLTGTFSRD